MSSPSSDAMRKIIATVQPVLKDVSYRKHASTFNRILEPDGLVHVVNFQRGMIPWMPPGEFHMAPTSQTYASAFTVNLGVWLPGIPAFPLGPADDRPGKVVGEADCQVRDRLGVLLPVPGEYWWPVSADGEAGEVVARALTQYGLPWLSQFTSWDEILLRFEAGPAGAQGAIGQTARLLAMHMRLARGEHDQAQRDFISNIEYLVSESLERAPHPDGSLAFDLGTMEKIAKAHHFNVDVQEHAAETRKHALGSRANPPG